MRKVMINELKVVEMSVKRHSLGWVETVDWIVMGQKRPTERRTFNMDGQVCYLILLFAWFYTAFSLLFENFKNFVFAAFILSFEYHCNQNFILTLLQLVQYTIGEADDRRWTFHYDLDGRLKAINDAKILFSNEKLKNVDQVCQTCENIRWN